MVAAEEECRLLVVMGAREGHLRLARVVPVAHLSEAEEAARVPMWVVEAAAQEHLSVVEAVGRVVKSEVEVVAQERS